MRAFALFLALITGACAHASTAPSTEATGGKRGCCNSDSCPMAQDGVQVVYEDTTDGAAMLFTASDVAGLQSRVAKMAEKHGKMAEPGEHGEHKGDHHGEHKGDHHGEHKGDHHGEQEVAHSARADNTAQGARLVMTPTDPAQLEALRAHVKGHVEKMQRGECPMKSCHE